MIRTTCCLLTLVLLLTATTAFAQSGQGSLRGYVKDEQGGVLPGVTVTAASPALIRPATAVSDAEGYYRVLNLPPGTYTVTAELSGFAAYKRADVLLRAGANYQVDVQMKLGSLAETVTVSGESPMIEVGKSSNVLNISGEFQRDMPIQARRNWSDFLEITPGVHSRPFDDGSGRMVYFGHGTEHFAHVIQLEGAIASNYQDAQVTYVAMGADMIDDVQVKTGGVDASAPMGTGLNINVITKSGGNIFKGSAAYAYQPSQWNGDNTNNCSPSAGCHPGTAAGGGTPTTAIVKQMDAGLGGRVVRDKVWFFGSLRRADLESGISRTPENVANLRAFYPNVVLFNNTTTSWQPYLKVTGKITPTHELVGFYQHDRLLATGDREYDYSRATLYSTGGSLYGAKATSVWGTRLTSSIVVAFNNKGGSDLSTYNTFQGQGPDTIIHNSAFVNGSRVVGNGRLIEGGNLEAGARTVAPSSLWTLRADFTYLKDGWIGSHEFQSGFFGAPQSKYDTQNFYINNGFILEERAMVDPNDASKGTVPFHRQYTSQLDIKTRQARDQNYGVYVQDNWKASARLTTNIGLRFDFVKRVDEIFNIVREHAWTIQPRFGFSYLVTGDAKSVLRGSYVRVGEQMMGRDAVTTFGGNARVGLRDEYGANLDKKIDAVVITAPNTASVASNQFAADLHQPFVDEFILGFRKQLPHSIGIDVAGIHRMYKETYANLEINGIYPSGPNQPFGGFGAIDPARGTIFREVNNTWSRLNYTALEITVTKNLSKGIQFMAGINRQWQHISGDWNPTDPARFIQPSAFPNDKLLYMPRGNNEENSLPLTPGGTTLTYGPTWQKYRLNFGGTYLAPFGITLAGSYTVEAGPWSGPVVNALPAGDPQLAVFGPGRTSNGQSNPLSTVLRYAYPTRGDGQVMAPAVRTLGLKIGKKIPLGGSRQAEIAANLFNLTNAGNYTQYNYNGASETFNPNFLQMRNQQAARALQMTFVYRF